MRTEADAWLTHLHHMQVWHANEAVTHPNPQHRTIHSVRARAYRTLIQEAQHELSQPAA